MNTIDYVINFLHNIELSWRILIVTIICAIVWRIMLTTFYRLIRKKQFGKKEKYKNYSISILGIILLACIGYGFYEPYTIKTTFTKISSNKITKPIRIVQLSDFHSDPTIRVEDDLPEIIRKLQPDLILLTGDYINSEAGLPVFQKSAKEIAKIAPTYGVYGNWEAWVYPGVKVFNNTGITKLLSDVLLLEIKEQKICLAGGGIDDSFDKIMIKLEEHKKDFRIFLNHFPEMWREADGRADLMLAGDTHNGQIVIPVFGPMIRMVRQDKVFYPHGLQQPGKEILMYVSRGLGMEGGAAPRVRFNCAPEVAVIDLLPENYK